ncbi:unnamed protein product [Mytilus edulis]|uniref:Endonuclease/exonuclease/phosphatase domain-containing protein n=1 Tax=Mytilus edulis TaxID=6550 RepID=A0A8S3UMJ9_MYTED|nr:unnamed protein product [Mytilus edulis]
METHFPDEFKGNVYRKDKQSDKHGGVFVAIKNTFVSEEAVELRSSIYHPHTTDINSMNEIKKKLEKAASFDNQTIWVRGDFNLPDIEWKDLSNAQVNDNAETTHWTSLTNKPSTIYRTEVCPGISDHDIIYAEATTTPIKENQTPRKVYQYEKADFVIMKVEENNFGNDFIKNHQISYNLRTAYKT